MSFQGADVSGLDRLTQRCQQGAQFARSLAKALEMLAAALEAMSWTGWAKAFAMYLRSVVIPWVKYIATCLERFGRVLQLASTAQKLASQDSPQISIPASALQLPRAPQTGQVAPPQLSAPVPAITGSASGGTPTGGGAAVAPTPTIGRTDGGSGTPTGGGTSTAPGTTIGSTGAGASTVGADRGTGSAVPPGGISTLTGYDDNGRPFTVTTVGSPTGALLGGVGASTGSLGAGGGISGSGTVRVPGTLIDDCFPGTGSSSLGTTGSAGALAPAGGPLSSPGASGAGGGGSAGGVSGGAGSGPIGGGAGLGSGGGTPSSGGGGATPSSAGASENPIAAGNPAVVSSGLGSVLGASTGGSGSHTIAAAAPAAGGASAGLLAAPLGLAGVGTAALAAMKATGAPPDADGEADDEL